MCKVHGKWLFKPEISFTFQLKCRLQFRAWSVDRQVFPKTSLSKLHFLKQTAKGECMLCFNEKEKWAAFYHERNLIRL